jgi:hypothetical protein
LALLTQHDPRRLPVHGTLAIVYMSFHRSGVDGTGSPGEAVVTVPIIYFRISGYLPDMRTQRRLKSIFPSFCLANCDRLVVCQ